MIPAGRSKNGTPLYANPCPDCAKERLSDARKIGSPCMSCANKRRSTHGLTSTKLYRLLKGAVARCDYPSATNYEYYGGRGIRVCDEWKNDPAIFAVWAIANGYAPGLELDRIEVNGNYEPGNCRFISHAENSRTRRNAQCDMERANRIRARLAEGVPIKAVAVEVGVPYMVAWHISKGNTWGEAA